MSKRVDVERLRAKAEWVGPWVRVERDDLAALLAVVDAARNGVLAWSEGAYSDIDCDSLEAALEPFGPEPRPAGVKVTNVGALVKDMAPPDRAWEEADRWNAEQTTTEKRDAFARLMDVDESHNPAPTRTIEFPANAKPNTFGNPRDRARDQLADAGVAVQRQFRSDQERIAELEAELAEEVAFTKRLQLDLAGVPALVEAAALAQSWMACHPLRTHHDAVWSAVTDGLGAALAEWEKP